jgi:hypothetical protein
LVDGRRKQRLAQSDARKSATDKPTGPITPEEVEKHTRHIFNLGSDSLGKVKKLKIKGARDFEIVDRVVRRAAGIDEETAIKVAVLVGVNERMEAHSLQRAGIIESTELPAPQQPGDRDAGQQGDSLGNASSES